MQVECSVQLSGNLLWLQALGKHSEDRQGSALKQPITGWRAVPEASQGTGGDLKPYIRGYDYTNNNNKQ